MTESQDSQANEAQIAVHWREEEYIYPPESFIAQANANDPAIFDRFTEDKFPDCFTEYADLLSWDEPWHTILDTSNPPFWKWFTGGKLNACYNCVDRHAEATAEQARADLGAGAGGRPTRSLSPTGPATAGSTSLPRCCGTSAA